MYDKETGELAFLVPEEGMTRQGADPAARTERCRPRAPPRAFGEIIYAGGNYLLPMASQLCYHSRCCFNGLWLSLVERCVRDAEVAGSNPVNPTTECKREPKGSLSRFRPSLRAHGGRVGGRGPYGLARAATGTGKQAGRPARASAPPLPHRGHAVGHPAHHRVVHHADYQPYHADDQRQRPQ